MNREVVCPDCNIVIHMPEEWEVLECECGRYMTWEIDGPKWWGRDQRGK